MMRVPAALPDFVAESQWIYWGCLLAVGIFLLWHGKQRSDRISFRIGGAVAVITALWIVASMLLVTPNERLYAAHRGLAQAVTVQDVPKILGFFDSETHIPALGKVQASGASTQVESKLKAYGIKGNTILGLDIQRTGTSAITQLRILTESDFGPVTTTWRIEWMDVSTADWKIVGIDLLRVGDQPTSIIPDIR